MIERVISGGQVGADIAGLRAAKKLGIPTSGYAPVGWSTTRGPQPELLKSFGLVEAPTKGYPQRTRLNVKNSDCTLRFAFNWDSGGERCTMREILRYKKPFFDIGIDEDELYPHPRMVAHFLFNNKIKILNVAGNAATRIEPLVEQYMIVVLSIVNKQGESNV